MKITAAIPPKKVATNGEFVNGHIYRRQDDSLVDVWHCSTGRLSDLVTGKTSFDTNHCNPEKWEDVTDEYVLVHKSIGPEHFENGGE